MPLFFWIKRCFGQFELLKQIGAGGQAEVYLARPLGRGRNQPLAAIKLATPAYHAALHDEHAWLAKPAAAHPNLAQLYSRQSPEISDLQLDSRAGKPQFGLALSYIPGESLAQMLNRPCPRPIPLEQALGLAIQLGQALRHLHETLGLVHYDLKPSNIMLSKKRIGKGLHAVLLDLGAAESIERPRRQALYGTSAYLPPECYSGAKPNPRVDIYALGKLLYLLSASQLDQPVAQQSVAAQRLSRLTQWATAPNPEQRPESMAAMLTALEECKIQSEGEASQCEPISALS